MRAIRKRAAHAICARTNRDRGQLRVTAEASAFKLKRTKHDNFERWRGTEEIRVRLGETLVVHVKLRVAVAGSTILASIFASCRVHSLKHFASISAPTGPIV